MLVSYTVIQVDERKRYLQFEDCPVRFVVEDGVYVGWYYAGEREDNG
jgi:hypothetical protein